MQAVGLFKAKTHLSEYVARAEAGEEVVIMRHHKPVAKIVPFVDKPEIDRTPVPKFVQRTFNMGQPLVDLTKANQLAGELEDQEFIKLTARLAGESKT
jgi:prevent-host-death family protein